MIFALAFYKKYTKKSRKKKDLFRRFLLCFFNFFSYNIKEIPSVGVQIITTNRR